MVIPITGQYEQKCNAEALREFGAEVISEIDIHFGATIDRFFHEPKETTQRYFQDSTNEGIVDQLMKIAIKALHNYKRQETSLPAETEALAAAFAAPAASSLEI